MNVLAKKDKGNLILSLIGELDDHTSAETRARIDEILDNAVYDSLIFDMTKLSFMDSTGIGVLIGRYKKNKGKHKIFIANPSKNVDMIFQISGLYNVMPKI
ncbi:MAG TPA: anti-sigma factor antagonist [Clostridia bacterium]|nr:anti-sigma factor antagonist [Clostridia bacterium]